ncbi:MAG: type II secretion system protein [Verrucomicrobiota bacterium]|nr:type II secretion system protein [Verrucomicrobiota bacterium]
MKSQNIISKTQGMTLIEILTVVVIIAVLMGMLFPVVTGVKNSARRAQANVECNGLVTAFKMYENEYGVFPSGVVTNTSSNVVAMLSGNDDPTAGYENPKRIRFFDFQQSRISNGAYYDPFMGKGGNPYQIQLDTNYTGVVTIPAPYNTGLTGGSLTNSVAIWMVTNSSANLTQFAKSWK